MTSRQERQAWRKKVVTVKDGNCFVEGSDFPGIGRLAAELNRPGAIGRLRKLCERWIYSTCLCFALPSENRKRSGFAYQYSVFQLELSRNLLFLRGTTMDEVYQKLIDRTRKPLDLKQVKTIFGFSYRPHQKAKRGHKQSEIFKAVEAPSYDLTVFKIKWRNLTLKIYDKGGRVLRIEAVVHNAKELRAGRMLDNLPGLIERARDMLVRFLDTIQAAHISFLDEAAFEGLSDPTTRGTKRLAGIDLNKARNRLVVDAVIALSTKPDGFTVAQLAESVHKRSGKPANAYSPRNAAYDLAKLTGKKLVRRIERSRRYAVDPFGVRTLCAYLLLREKVIKPLLAGVTRPYRRSPKIIAPLDQHYLKLRQELHQTFETIGFAAA
jgi:DNA-binding transcriptional ArsR family regulator